MFTKKAPVKKVAAKKKAPAKKLIENNQIRKTRASVPRPGNGGARKNSGRKKGAATMKTREIANKASIDGGLTPLEFMLQVLREAPKDLKAQYKKRLITAEELEDRLKDINAKRYKAAVDSATYMHPRLSSIEAKISINEQDEWTKEKAAIAQEGKKRAATKRK